MTTGVQLSQLPAALVIKGDELVPVVSVGHVSGITNAVNAVITINDSCGVNPFSAGMTVSLAGVGGMTQVNGLEPAVSAAGGIEGAWTITVPVDSTAFGAYTSGGEITVTAQTVSADLQMGAAAQGLSPYNATFQSGGVNYNGANGVLAADNNLIYGKIIPNPSGTPGPCLLKGSGGGSGANVQFWDITDQAFDLASPGNDIGRTAGEVQPNSTQRGGNITDLAGAADLGQGGQWLAKGGTSARGAPGLTVLQGADNTDESHPAGDVFAVAGETGSQGGILHLIATLINGVAGFIRHRFNSTITIDEYADGSWFFYSQSSFGNAGAPLISRGAGNPMGPALSSEVVANHVMPVKALTGGGANGSLTIKNGLIVAVTDPT